MPACRSAVFWHEGMEFALRIATPKDDTTTIALGAGLSMLTSRVILNFTKSKFLTRRFNAYPAAGSFQNGSVIYDNKSAIFDTWSE